MRKRFDSNLRCGFFVILLTIFNGCAVVSSITHSSDDDPVTKAALHQAQISQSENTSPLSSQSPEILEKAIYSHEIFLGMRMRDVLVSWGHPREIQTAGEEDSANQKWIYKEGLTFGLQVSAPRVVYFENGHVVGWENAKTSFNQ